MGDNKNNSVVNRKFTILIIYMCWKLYIYDRDSHKSTLSIVQFSLRLSDYIKSKLV